MVVAQVQEREAGEGLGFEPRGRQSAVDAVVFQPQGLQIQQVLSPLLPRQRP